MDDQHWEYELERYLMNTMTASEKEAFARRLDKHPEREAEVELRQLEQRAMQRFYEYTQDQPDAFPESFPGTKLYFASLFSSALFLGTFSARVSPTDDTPENDSDQEPPPSSGSID